jgi:hypothetical protein
MAKFSRSNSMRSSFRKSTSTSNWNEKAYQASLKGNPNHDKEGKFSSSATHGPDKSLDHKTNDLQKMGKSALANNKSNFNKTMD